MARMADIISPIARKGIRNAGGAGKYRNKH
jgi:hypothetical protein